MTRGRLDLASIYVVSRTQAPVTEEALDETEARLGSALPKDYRALVRALGTGTFTNVLDVHSPREIADRHAAFVEASVLATAPERFRNWADVLMPSDATKLFPIACSLDGDEVCCHCEAPELVFVLPRHRSVLAACSSFLEALEWFAFSGAYWPKMKRAWFEPTRTAAARVIAFPEHRVDDVIALLADELTPDADDGGDPPLNFFYARAGAIICVSDGRLHARVDSSSATFLDELGARVERRLALPPGDDDEVEDP